MTDTTGIDAGGVSTALGRRARRIALRAAGPLAVAGLAVWAMRDRLAEIEGEALIAALAAAPVAAIVAALILTVLSHVFISGYDVFAARRLGLNLGAGRLLAGGFAAGAVAQTLGFGAVTGSLARWRAHAGAGVGPAEAAALTGMASLGFFTGVAGFLALVTLIDPSAAMDLTGASASGAQSVAALALAGLVAVCAATARRRFRVAGLDLRGPDLGWLVRSVALTAGDLIAAGLALWVLMPMAWAPAPLELIAVFAAALGLGLLTGAPGGAGVFEAALIVAFPTVPAAELAASILMFRVIYHGPTLVAALVLLRRAPRRAAGRLEAPETPETPSEAEIRDRVQWILDDGDRAEGALAWLGDKRFMLSDCGRAFVMYAVQGRRWVALGDPQGPRAAWGPLVDKFEAAARAARGRVAIYKSDESARDFWAARGWKIQKLGEEGALDLAAFTLDTPERRELRRKLSRLKKAGVTIVRRAPGEADPAELADVAEAWTEGGAKRERSFSMGHWDWTFARRHELVEARKDGRLVGFVTAWTSGDGAERMLDLMRLRPDAPDGTMHALIVEAALAAQEAGAARFNLCMAPFSGLDDDPAGTRLSKIGARIYASEGDPQGLRGLRRFKEIFRPDWTARNLVCRSVLEMPAALVATHRLVEGGARDPGAARLPIFALIPTLAPRPRSPRGVIRLRRRGAPAPVAAPAAPVSDAPGARILDFAMRRRRAAAAKAIVGAEAANAPRRARAG
ncbi:MAG: hypothetical protein CML43_05305 [Rhodobacteraceae bacterium]|nr:hypothetical protein [Paracoccaceae bacterium]